MNNRNGNESQPDGMTASLARPPVRNGRFSSRKRDPRFRQLLALARDGDEPAISDLFREFNFDFGREGGRDDVD